MKKIFITTLLTVLFTATFAYAAPTYRIERTILPETDATYELGTTSRAWYRVFADQFCLTGDDCITTWTSGGGGNIDGTGSAGMLASWVDEANLTATSTPTADSFYATNTNSTTTLQRVRINGLLDIIGNIISAVTFTNTANFQGQVTFDNNYPLGPGTTPTLDDELVDKAYADGLQAGFLYKAPVIVVATSSVTLSGEQTIDGFLTSASRVLLIGQSTASQNGCYVTASGAWSRCTDYNQDAEVIQGTTFLVINGDTQEGTAWALLTTGATVGVTNLEFIQVSKPQDITASNGLIKIANDIQALYDDVTIGLSGGALAIKNGAIDLAGSLISGVLGIVNGGTGTSTTPTNGQLLIGNGTGYSLSTLTAGDNVTITNGAGSIEISASGGGASATTSLGSTITTVTFVATPQTAQTWTNMPPTETEIFNATSSTANTFTRQRIDLTRGETFQLSGRQAVAGTAGATLKMQCSSDASTWTDAGDSGATIDIGVLGTQPRVGNLSSLNSACKGYVFLRLVGAGGNDVNDPSWRSLKADIYLTRPSVGGTATSTTEVSIGATPQTAQTWTNQPAATTEIFGTTNARFFRDTTNATGYRLFVNQAVAGFAGADLNLQCSTDNVSFIAADTGGAGEVDVGTGTGLKNGDEVSLSSGCVGSRYWRLVGKQGNGVVDPSFRQIKVQFTYTEDATGGSGGGSNWSFDTNFGTSVLTPSSTIPVWLKSSLYASSTSFFSGLGTWLNGLAVTGATSTFDGIRINNGKGLTFQGYSSIPQIVSADLQTGLHFDGPGIISFHNSGSQSALFNGLGNFGLGSTSPSKKLSVIGDSYLKGITSIPLRVEDSATGSNLSVTFKDLTSLGVGIAPVIKGQFSNGLFGTGFEQSIAVFASSTLGFRPSLTFYNEALSDFASTVYSTSSDQLSFEDANSYIFDNSVGISTTTPSFDLSVEGIGYFVDNVSSTTAPASLKIYGQEIINAVQGTILEGIASNGNQGLGTIRDFIVFGGNSFTPQISLSTSDLLVSANIGLATSSDTLTFNNASGGYSFNNLSGSSNSIRLAQTSVSGGFGTVEFPYVEFNTPGGILSPNTGGFWGGFAILENPSFGGNPNMSFIASDISDTGNAATFEYATTSQTVIISKQFKIRDANDDIILTFQNDAEDADANIEYDELTDILKIQGASTSLSVFPQVGADPMCWDGSGESVIGDCTSLAKYKTNIKSLDSGLADILALSPRIFNWKDDMREDVGFIAEEVEEVNPKLAKYTDGELSGYKERAIVASLVNAVKDQQNQIENLKVGVVEVKRTAEENWQWFAIILLFIFIGIQQVQIIRLRK